MEACEESSLMLRAELWITPQEKKSTCRANPTRKLGQAEE